jgi:hypothetical protein
VQIGRQYPTRTKSNCATSDSSGGIYTVATTDRFWPTAAARVLSSQALVIVTAYSSTW